MHNHDTSGGKHRRADGDEKVLTQVVIGQGHIWRWSEARHAWQVIA